MTKTIENLRKNSFKEDVLDNHIANTYFYQKNRPKIRRKKTAFAIPAKMLVHTAAASSIVIATVILAVLTFSFLHTRYISSLKKRVLNSKTIRMIERGYVNKEIVKAAEFSGYAKNGTSNMPKDILILSNPKKYRWADLSISFKFPLDLSRRNLSLSLKGAVGGEKINIVLKDANNRSYKLDSVSLSSSWQDKVISLDSLQKDIDISSISQLRIESAYVGESSSQFDSPINVTIYVRNIKAIKEMGI